MSRTYAGWAQGAALSFGWQLGVTAAHCDIIDYRAMLARMKYHAQNHRIGERHTPARVFVSFEIDAHESYRSMYERHNGALA